MNRRIHRKLLQVMGVLEQIHLEIKKNMDTADNENACRLLAECQSIAMEIGTTIEKSEGVGTKTVSLLEAYCETVYELHGRFSAGVSVESEYVLMQMLYEKIQKSIHEDIDVKMHIVFLPYKRAMWDSMESVWQAACADSECVAEIMPIPYYDKNTDGSLGEIHYEAQLYDVPVLDYEKYDLAEMQPDVIVVHNPYDQYNRVTTVHPYFYMKNLREWTDKLVYIPYFVHANCDTAYKYAVLPGTIYPDLVVLQSEEARQKYIECFYKETGRIEGLEKRFVALGSPKYDWIRRKNEEIPKEWEKFLGEDGKRKKVVFFNTHLNYIMPAHSEAFFEKLKGVFEVFKERKDVVLLWRPHPLTLSTAQSLNPEAVETYLKLIDYYKTEKIGIYDETPDFRLALNLADAYYGCSTSIKELFEKSGKPIMILRIYR